MKILCIILWLVFMFGWAALAEFTHYYFFMAAAGYAAVVFFIAAIWDAFI